MWKTDWRLSINETSKLLLWSKPGRGWEARQKHWVDKYRAEPWKPNVREGKGKTGREGRGHVRASSPINLCYNSNQTLRRWRERGRLGRRKSWDWLLLTPRNWAARSNRSKGNCCDGKETWVPLNVAYGQGLSDPQRQLIRTKHRVRIVKSGLKG